MSISNLPAELQPIIQKGFLERMFLQGLRSKLGYRQAVDRERFPIAIGETITKTRTGLKAPATTPLDPTTIDSNLDNGLTASNFTIEQYTMDLNLYGDTIDLNLVTSKVEIADRFAQNAFTNGEQAMQTLDRLARNKLYDGYMGANSWVRVTLGAPNVTIEVDDIRHFSEVFVNGELVPVDVTNTRNVTVGDNVYVLTAVAADVTNVSSIKNFGGISGTLTFSTTVTVADGTLGNGVIAENAAVVLRPNLRESTYQLVAADVMTMALLRQGITILRNNAIPTINGFYNCYLDSNSMDQLYNDTEFQSLYRGDSAKSKEYKIGIISQLLGVNFITTTEAYQQTLAAGGGTIPVRRPVLCGKGILIEGTYDGIDADLGKRIKNNIIRVMDDVVMATRPPLDRLGMLIAQSWYWSGGYAVPTDSTATEDIIPTANDSYYKRGVVFETA